MTGGAGTVALAVYGDYPHLQNTIDEFLNRVEGIIATIPKQASTPSGIEAFYTEGQGPSHTATYPGFTQYWVAMKNVMGRDYISANEELQWLSFRWIGETISQDGRPIYPMRHESFGFAYGSEDLVAGGGLTETGRFSLGFGIIPEEYKPEFLWMYNNYFRDAEGDRYNAINYPHLAISALVHWPIGVTPEHPDESFDKFYRDTDFDHYIFRNGWTVDDDIIITVLRSSTRHSGETMDGLSRSSFGRWGRSTNIRDRLD